MTDTHAQIASKGLDATGFTEELAAELFHKVGSHLMAIVDLQVVDRSGPNVKDKRKVHLIIDGIEPAVDDDMAEHLRELSRVGYLNRAHANGTAAINQELDGERTVADVLAAGKMHRPHPFLPVDVSIENGICDVCGALEAVAVHSKQEVLPDGDDEDHEGLENEHDDEGDDHNGNYDDADDDGPHAYDAGPDDVCQCGLPFEDDTHAPAAQDDEEQDEEPDGADVEQWQTTTPPEVHDNERHLATVPDPFTA